MKAERNRQRIIHTALALFAERGYAETALSDVAEGAGVLKGNLSYYFRTKADLLEAAASALQSHYLARITDGLPADADAHTALNHFLDVVDAHAPALARTGCPIGTLCSELGKDAPALQRHASDVLAAVQGWLAARFARVLSPATADLHAEQLLVMMQGAAVLAHAFGKPDTVYRQTAVARAWLRTVFENAASASAERPG